MKKVLLFVGSTLSILTFSQTSDYKKAPNSYIYDINLAKSSNYEGIFIPVKKAYEMWDNFVYLQDNGASTPIPNGTQTATLYWEDVPGLISDVSLVSQSNPEDSKIRISINEAKGKGNAVVAFKVNNQIYWSWHIWVTDNPKNGVTYQQGWETDVNNNVFTVEFMDRNLGAVSKGFVGNNWNKSGGLMYEWGRKDPFPPLLNKDSYFYELNGEVGNLKHTSIAPNNSIPIKIREFDEIEKNIKYSVQNPLTYIINTDVSGNWFSNQRYKVAGTNSVDYVSWDLWADNAKGAHSNANSSSTTLKNESKSYELKSEFDPCPNGYRVPSYYGRVTHNNNLAFFGRKWNWNNDDPTTNSQIKPDIQNSVLDGVEVYPGLGMDFTNSYGGNRNIGVLPTPGAYVYYPNSAAPNAPVGVVFQDNNANGGFWSATYGYDGARLFSMISDPERTNTSVGLHAIYINETNPSRSGNAVRCMKDPNLALIGDFATEYFQRINENYIKGIDNPNTYIVKNQNTVNIPVNKAFSVYNQLLTDHESLITSNLVAKVLWTDNPNLISSLTITNNSSDVRESKINVSLNSGVKGNAVISLHDADTSTPALWSWLIWSPNGDPELANITYTTEQEIPTNYNFVQPTNSNFAPIENEFMDRNLGATNVLESNSNVLNGRKSQGLHFQWGRKDAIPSFALDENGMNTTIYLGSENSSQNGIITYTNLDSAIYQQNFTKKYSDYLSASSSKHIKVQDHIKYSVQNPMEFMYHEGVGNIYDGGTHNNNLSEIRDWVLDETNQSAQRWGHADKKSAFDPCPDGWRVPDVSYTNLYTGSKGTSPWYNGYKNDAYGNSGVIQDQWHNVTNHYQGAILPNLGWIFNGTNYQIGNFPLDGIRGELGNNQLSYDRSGVWTASLADHATGYALAMLFEGNKVQSGTGVYPQAAMGVRCAKDVVRYLVPDSNGNLGIEPESSSSNLIKDLIEVYPNPFTSIIHIKNKEAEAFEIYDFSGRLILKGNVKNSIVDGSLLNNGVYIMKLKMKNNEAAAVKIYKK